jgi:hypothetical protein
MRRPLAEEGTDDWRSAIVSAFAIGTCKRGVAVTTILPPEKLNRIGFRVLLRELGIVNAIRFIQQYSPGEGNYTIDRDELLAGLSLDDLVTRIEQRDSTKCESSESPNP